MIRKWTWHCKYHCWSRTRCCKKCNRWTSIGDNIAYILNMYIKCELTHCQIRMKYLIFTICTCTFNFWKCILCLSILYSIHLYIIHSYKINHTNITFWRFNLWKVVIIYCLDILYLLLYFYVIHIWWYCKYEIITIKCTPYN